MKLISIALKILWVGDGTFIFKEFDSKHSCLLFDLIWDIRVPVDHAGPSVQLEPWKELIFLRLEILLAWVSNSLWIVTMRLDILSFPTTFRFVLGV